MSVYLDDGDVRLIHGDVCAMLAALPAESVQCVVTSPPYWGLRDYGTASWTGGDDACDHLGPPKATQAGFNERYFGRESKQTDKQAELRVPYRDACGRCGAQRVDQQIGLEESPAAYVERLVAVFREVRRVLRRDGVVFLNLGDSYAHAVDMRSHSPSMSVTQKQELRAAGGAVPKENTRHASARHDVPTGLKVKDLVGIPWRVAFALQDDGWWLRSDIVWSKPNPMPESVTDRPTRSHEYVFVLTRSARYYWDSESIREAAKPWNDGRMAAPSKHESNVNGAGYVQRKTTYAEIKGANARSVWTIATQPTPEAHFATFPEALVERCILAGTCEVGCCPKCGSAWKRVSDRRGDPREFDRGQTSAASSARRSDGSRLTSGTGHRTINGATPSYRPPEVETIGWRQTCACTPDRAEGARSEAVQVHGLSGAASGGAGGRERHLPDVSQGLGAAAGLDPVPCVILDPFMGSGTTALVARKHGRHAIGIDLNAEYLAIAARRLQQLSLLA